MRVLFLLLGLLINLPVFGTSPKNRLLVPVPHQAQLVWKDAELVAIFHYDLHVFDSVAYNQTLNRITPIQDVNIFNPSQLDTDQWIRSVKAMGAKIAIITATHESGFAIYQSDANPYCMKVLKWRNGKGDIVRDFVRSCRKYGVLPGVYIGIRWNSLLGVHDFMMPKDGSQFQANRQVFYNHMCEGMTKELMSRYGDLAIVWYDGDGHGPELGGPDILPIVEKYQKNIIFYHNSQRADIRWGGSETGMVPYPCWGTYPFPYSHSKNQAIVFKCDNRLLKYGDANGAYYMPAMSDSPLRGYKGRHEWFWEPHDEQHIYSLDNLMEIYENSVGHNSTLIIGVAPDNRGLVPDEDVKRLKEFGDEIKRRYGTPLASVSGVGNVFSLNFKPAVKVNAAVISENITKGERVRSYKIEGKIKGKWRILSSGTCIGHKKIDTWEPQNVSALRLYIKMSEGKPYISAFSAHRY